MNNRTNPNFSLRKLLLTALVAGPLATLPAPLWALPSVTTGTGGNLTTSSGVSVSQVSATSINVTAPDKGVLSWNGFGNVAQPFNNGDTINFFQPTAASSVLNVVTGGFYSNGGTVDATFASTLNGTIAGNGNVYFLNPNGLTIGATAQINVGGFYASTVGETLPGANFGINGALTFTGATTATQALTVTNGANLQAVGTGLNIKLYGRGVNVQGGNFYGNVSLASNGASTTLGSTAAVTVNSVAGSGGSLSITTAGGSAVLSGGGALFASVPTVTYTASPGTTASSTATINTTTTAGTGGRLTSAIVGLAGGTGYTAAPTVTVTDGISTYTTTATVAGGAVTGVTLPVYSTTANQTTVAGSITIDTKGSSSNGGVATGASTVFANGSGTRVSVDAGTGTSAGNVFLGNGAFAGLSANGNNVTLLEASGAGGLTLSTSSINGNFTLNAGNANVGMASGATIGVGGSIALATSGDTLTFAGTGNLTFASLSSGSTTTITTNGDVTLPNAGRAAFSLPSASVGAAPQGGTNATAPTFNAAQTAGLAISAGGVLTVTSQASGTGYTSAPNYTISALGYPDVSVPTTIAANAVNGIAATTLPDVFTTPTATTATLANIYAVPSNATVSVTTSPGTNAVVTLNNTGTYSSGQINNVNAFTIGTAGAGYTAAPTVTVTAPNGTTQTFSTTIDGTGAVTGVLLGTSVATFSQGRTLSVTTSGGKITSGVINAGSTVTLNAAGDIIVGGISAPGSALSITSSGGSFSSNFFRSGTNTTLVAQGNINLGAVYGATGGTQTITSRAGNITVGEIANTGASLSLVSTAGTLTASSLITSRTSSALSLTAANSIALPRTAVTTLNVTSTAGSITQTGAITQNQATVASSAANTSKSTFSATGDITLTNTANDFNLIVLQGGANSTAGFSVVDSTSILLAGGTSVRAPATTTTSITSGAGGGTGWIALGTIGRDSADTMNINTADSISISNNLSLTANTAGAFGTGVVTNNNNPALGALSAAINTFANNIYVFGTVTANTNSNNNVLLGTPGLGNLANYSWGGINGNVGSSAVAGQSTFTVNENTTLNLGALTAATLNASSINANIVNTAGALTVGTAVLSAGAIFSPNNITLSSTSNQVTQINLINANNVDITTGAAGAGTTVTAGSTTLNGKSVLGNLVVTEVNGKNLTINSAGAGSFNNVGFNASGNVAITAPGSVTLQNATNSGTGTVSVDFAVGTTGVISLGSGIALNSSGLVSLTATGTSGRIVDSAPNVFISGPVDFRSSNDIAITRTGHSIGPVSLRSGTAGGTPSSADITYTEGGTANLNVVLVNSGAGTVDGNLKVVSTGGSIIQTTTTGTLNVPSGASSTNTASFQAAGGVTLSNPAATNSVLAPITISAVTDSSVLQGANVRLGNTSVTGGGIIVDTSASGAATITQTTGSSIFSFGATGLKSGGGAIAVGNSGNNFGALSVASAGGNVSLAEVGTMNLASVVTGAGNFTVNAGSVIETGNVVTFASGAPVSGLNVGGTATFTAGASGVTLTSTNTSIGTGGITITTTGNVSLTDSALTTRLGTGTSIGGSLTVRNTNAGPNSSITDNGAGNLTVGGNVLFDLVNGNVAISGANNTFGAVGFRANTVAISENTTLNLNGGSVASGPVTLSSNGDIITSGLGPLTFAGAATSLTLSAGGNITISNAATFVSNGLTFLARGAVDLSALSIIGNLNGRTPTNLGAASYKTPSP